TGSSPMAQVQLWHKARGTCRARNLKHRAGKMTKNNKEKQGREIKLRGEPSFVGRALSLALAPGGIRTRLQSCHKAQRKSGLPAPGLFLAPGRTGARSPFSFLYPAARLKVVP